MRGARSGDVKRRQVGDEMTHHRRDDERAYERADVENRHVGGGRVGPHLLFGPSLQRNPALGEQGRRVPEAAEDKDDDRCDEDSQPVHRGEVLHAKTLRVWWVAREAQKIYARSASPAATERSSIAALAAAPSSSAAGS